MGNPDHGTTYMYTASKVDAALPSMCSRVLGFRGLGWASPPPHQQLATLARPPRVIVSVNEV